MSTLFIFATELEASPFINKCGFVPCPDHDGLYERTPDFLLVCGIGPVTAARAAGSLHGRKFNRWVNAGIAGALKPLAHLGQIIELGHARLHPSADLKGRPLTEHFGDGATALTLTAPLHSLDEKKRLAKLGDLVEMESYALAFSARMVGAEFVGYKIISDFADRPDTKIIIKRCEQLGTELIEVCHPYLSR